MPGETSEAGLAPRPPVASAPGALEQHGDSGIHGNRALEK